MTHRGTAFQDPTSQRASRPSSLGRRRAAAAAHAVLVVSGLVAITQRLSAASNNSCASPDSLHVPRLTHYLTELIVSDNPVYRSVRDSVGLQRAAQGHVHLERRVRQCQAGLAALNRILGTPGQARLIWLFDLGVGYAIQDPGLARVPGQSEPMFIFDRRWRYKSTLMEQ